MTPFEFAGADTGLVGTQTLNSLNTLVFREEASGGNIIVKFPVNDWCGDDGDEADKKEDTVKKLTLLFCRRIGKKHLHLPRTYMLAWDMAQAVT